MENRYTVLIVDDSQFNLEFMSDLLRDSYDIITAEGGEQALEIMRREPRPDVVLLDMLMPHPDGYEVLDAMREDDELSSLPVIVITEDNAADAQSRAFALGAVDFIHRGEDVSSVTHRVKSVLRLCELDKIRRENERLRGEITSERRLSALMDNLPGGVAIIRTNGKRAECTYFNSKLPALFRMNSDSFAMQFAMPVQTRWISEFVREAENSDSFTFAFSVGDPHIPELCQWIRVTAHGLGKRDGMSELYCVFLDINAEKHQELRAEESGRQLRENQSRLETVVNNAPGGISFSERGDDGNFRTLFINRGLADMLGYDSEEECLNDIGTAPCLGVSPNDVAEIRRRIADIPEEGGHFKYAFRLKKRNDHELWLTMRCQLMHGENTGRVQMFAFITNITKEKRFEDELRTAAFFDPLTGLYNRHAFLRNARRVIDDNPLMEFSLMKLNIGSFKVVNDLLGREVGDKVLMTIADAVRGLFADRSVFARFFSDNFMILTPYNERGVHPQMVLDTVQRAVSESGLLSHEIQYYIGVYRITDREMSVENMTDRASIACRSINGSYQEHIAYYDEKMRLTMLEEQQICDESRRALRNGEFCVYYQPVYGIKAKRFVSAEALVRWIHPTKGMINPGKFVPVFEKNGFIAELDIYVLEQVCKYMKKRRDAGLPDFPLSVNISRMSLYDPNLFDTISDITDRYDIDPRFFRIEITESAYNDNPAQLLETVGKLRGKCYPVLMDDFGSGYSSLNTLKDIPIDILKLDMKFMQGFEKNGKVGTIVTSVSRMSKWLNIPLLAEGVETKEQFDFLSSVGCAYIQGFYFSRPVPEEELSHLIELEEVSGDALVIENYALGEEVNELLGSNALVSKLISGAFGGFGIYEMYEGKLEVIRVNEGYMQIMGYTPEDFNEDNINIWDKMPEEYVEVSRKACLEALETDKAVRSMVRRYDKNGKLLYLDGIHRRLGGTYENPIICIAFNDITEQVEDERRIDRSYTEIEEILKATNTSVGDIDLENGTVFTAGDLSDYGISMDKIVAPVSEGDAFISILHPDDAERAKEFHNKRASGKRTEEFRLRNLKDGKYYWWKVAEVCTFGDDGKLTRMIGIASNIDAEKRAKLALEEERSHIDMVMSRLGAGILMVEVSDDHEAHIIYSNDSFWKTVGVSNVNDINFFSEIYAGVDDEERRRIDEAAKSGGTVNLMYHLDRDNGEKAVMELTIGLSRADEGKRVYMVIVSDVTERHNDRMRLDAIVRNFHDGLALANIGKNGVDIYFANDKFYSVMNVARGSTARLGSMIETVVSSRSRAGDVRIKHGSVNRIVRLSMDEIGKMSNNETGYIITASDVTLARSKSANRIAERTANAAAGLYDQVFEINYRSGTVRLTSSRRLPERAANSKPRTLDSVTEVWAKKYISPNDLAAFREFMRTPVGNPDFTDSYCEIGILDIDGKYHTTGVVMVRQHTDVCMMFTRDKARIDDSLTSAQVEETSRLYRLVAEQSRTAVIEINHIEKKVSCSPLFKEFWSVEFSDVEGSQYENLKQGPIIYPDDLEKYEKFMGELYKSEEPQTITLRMKMADGSFKWCRMTISIERGKDGRVLTSLCTINFVHDEIVARMEAEQKDAQMEETNRLYRLIAEQSRTAVIEINHIEKKISCSPLFKEFWTVEFAEGDSQESVKQGPIVYPDDLEKYERFMKDLYGSDEPQTITLRMKMADGSFKWCRMTISIERGMDGKVLTSLCTINFVHDEVVARMKAEQTDALLRRTVANIPVGVGVYKLEAGKPIELYVSDYMNDMVHTDAENEKSRFFDIGRFMEKNGIAVIPGTEGSRITQIKRADGSSFWASVIYRVLDEGGEFIIYVAIADVTDRVESQRREAAREQMYGMLLNDSGTIVFDYDPQTDTFTYLLHSGENNIVCIDRITENLDGLTLIQNDDRTDFLDKVKNLPLSSDSEEMIVRICMDGYTRRGKALFKSVADEDGNVFKIVGNIEDVEDDLARMELMQEKAMYDSLCVDIFNKSTTEELIRAELEIRTSGALMMIDVDDFKSINDSLGHMFGDEFLKKFASTIKSTFRESDIVGRYGGDEFFVFMPNAAAAFAEKKAQLLLEKVSEINVPIKGGVKSSIGIAAVTPDNRDYRRILKQADSALYQAKNRGKNCAVLFEGSMNEESYRTQEAVERGRTKATLSSSPGSAASVAMRVFSALYTSSDVAEGINQMLALVGKTYDVSRVYIFEDSDDGEYCCNTFEWCGEGVSSEMASLQRVSYEEDLGGNYRDNMGEDGIFYCHDINELQEDQRDILAQQNIKSVLQCAIMYNGRYKGFVGFDECRSNRFWTQDQIDSLAFISKVLSIFLMMDRTKTRAENYAQSLKSILDDLPQILYIVDGETFELLYYNKMTERHFGAEKIGCRCFDEICRGDPRDICPIKRLRESGDGSPIEMFSPILNKRIKLRASEIRWDGKPAYIVNCMLPDE